MITKQELEAQANRLIAAAKAKMELQGDFPVTMLIHTASQWEVLPFPEQLQPLMNHGKAKDIIFGALRKTVQARKADGVIIASDTWQAETTPEGAKHYSTPEWKALHNTGFEKLLQRGWVKRYEAFMVTAQNPTDVLLVQQKYQRLESGMIQLLSARRDWFDQAGFMGRQKMFGDLREENLGSEEVEGTPRSK